MTRATISSFFQSKCSIDVRQTTKFHIMENVIKTIKKMKCRYRLKRCLSDKMIFELISETQGEASHIKAWGRTVQAEGILSTKALRRNRP